MKNIIPLIFLTLFFNGCSIIGGYQKDIDKFNQNILTQNCDYSEYEEKISDKNDVILAANQAGILARICGDFQKSNDFFDISEFLYKKSVDEKGMLPQISDEITAVLTNENALSYEGNYYERIMVNVYKGLNFLTIGDKDNARVEFNRALERQTIAKKIFAQNITKIRQNLQNQLSKAAKDSRLRDTPFVNFSSQYQNDMNAFMSYPNFINPFATYISGLFFMLDNDYAKGADLIKESLAMESTNPVLQADFTLANALASSNFTSKNKKYIWLIYENGRSVGLTEGKLKIGTNFQTGAYIELDVAYPELTKAQSSYKFLKLNSSKTVQIADMDGVIKTEFANFATQRITRAITRSITKLGIQAGAAHAFNVWGMVAMFIYDDLTNKADIRHLSALASNFQVARVLNSGVVQITTDGNEILDKFSVSNDKNIIIYVKSLQRSLVKIDKILF